MGTWNQDLLYGFRALLQRPAFSAVVLLTLALGIGANSAIFSLVDGVLLKPLSYPGSAQLMTVWENLEALGGPRDEWTSGAIFYEWRERQRVFTDLALWSGWSPNLTSGDEPMRLTGQAVSSEFFAVLGVQPSRGRSFLPAEGRPGGDKVVILSHQLWQRRFAGDPELIGKALTLDDDRYLVIGVLPADFRPFTDAEIWSPLAVGPGMTDRGSAYLRVVGRLRQGIGPQEAQADMSRVAAEVAAAFPETHRDIGATVIPLIDNLVGPARPPLIALLGAVALVLLIACINVANLLIVRAAGRQREMAVRSSLGASRWRIVRQLLIESLLLAALAGILGLIFGSWALEALRALAPDGAPRLDEVALNGRVLLFTCGISLATGLFFGLAPVLQVSRLDLASTLQQGARNSASVTSRRLRSALVVGEIALALALATGAGLLIKSFWKLVQVDPGFQIADIVTGNVILPATRYDELAQRVDFFDAVLTRLAEHGAVDAVGAISVLPLGGNDSDVDITFASRPRLESGLQPTAWYRLISPGYLTTLRIPLVAGRGFTDDDRDGSQPVVILNRRMAEHIFPGEDPLGRRLKLGGPDSTRPWRKIVGVIGDIHHRGLDQTPREEIYLPLAQRPGRMMSLVLRGRGGKDILMPLLRSTVREVDPALPIANPTTMEQLVADSVATPRFVTQLLTTFAALALLLSALGIYGLLAYAIHQRKREIGVRMALGARRRDVVQMVIRQGGALIGLGLGVGIGGALMLNRVLENLLFEVGTTDPWVFATALVLLFTSGLVACYLPARRAALVDPVISLRYE